MMDTGQAQGIWEESRSNYTVDALVSFVPFALYSPVLTNIAGKVYCRVTVYKSLAKIGVRSL